jgi:outer membrane protein assembly factor BamB
MTKLTALAVSLVAVVPIHSADDWPQFRGLNSSGISDNKNLPVEFGPNKNVVWKTELPPGYSSPVLVGDRIFLTAIDNEKLFTICLDRASGRINWRREVPRPRKGELHTANGPASPSPTSDGKSVFVFYYDFGLVSYGPDGNERWRMPLGPFNNPFGLSSSPVLVGDTLLINCDQESGSFLLAVDKNTGKVRWRVERPEYTRGFSTPVIYTPPDGQPQALIAGSYRLTAYSVDTGKAIWWVNGLTWQLKPTPVLGKGVVYVQNWAGGSDTGQQEDIPPFEDTLARLDANHDGKIQKDEIKDPKILDIWREIDLENDGALDERDWKFYRSRRSAHNGLIAFRLGGQGDMTEKSLLWRYEKSLPNVPSPLLYKDVLYMMKEGGIFTSVDPATGKVLKQARLTGALGDYFSSPVAADDKIYTLSEEGKVTVIKPGREWEILAVNDLGDSCRATPAIADGRLYIRTRGALYCFAKRD